MHCALCSPFDVHFVNSRQFVQARECEMESGGNVASKEIQMNTGKNTVQKTAENPCEICLCM